MCVPRQEHHRHRRADAAGADRAGGRRPRVELAGQALELQHRLGDALPLRDAMWVGTHNSFNTISNTPPSLSNNDSNQHVSLVDQLRLGVRGIEVDVHWNPSVWANGAKAPVVCHARGTDQYNAGCTYERLLNDELKPVGDWLRQPAPRRRDPALPRGQSRRSRGLRRSDAGDQRHDRRSRLHAAGGRVVPAAAAGAAPGRRARRRQAGRDHERLRLGRAPGLDGVRRLGAVRGGQPGLRRLSRVHVAVGRAATTARSSCASTRTRRSCRPPLPRAIPDTVSPSPRSATWCGAASTCSGSIRSTRPTRGSRRWCGVGRRTSRSRPMPGCAHSTAPTDDSTPARARVRGCDSRASILRAESGSSRSAPASSTMASRPANGSIVDRCSPCPAAAITPSASSTRRRAGVTDVWVAYSVIDGAWKGVAA